MPITLNGTLGIDAPLGTSSVPSYGNTTNTNTGLYFPSSTTLGLSTNGTAALTIDASQNVGIGTSSPAVKLDINGTNPSVRIVQTVGGYENYLGVDSGNLAWNGSTNGTSWGVKTNNVERMRIDTSGNVGIGTSSPSSFYGVPTRLAILNNQNAATILAIANGTVGASAGVSLNMTGGTGNSYTQFTLNDNNGSPAYVFNFGSAITSVAYGTLGASPITWFTNNAERMRIDSSGNVGIGTTSPGYRLEVKGASGAQGYLSIHDGTGDTTVSGNNAASLLFQTRDTSIRTIAEIDAVNTTTNGTGGAMVFQTRISDTLAERMRIDSSGNLLVGTTSAVGKATIAGNLSIQGSDSSIVRSGGNAWLMVSSNTGYGSSGAHLKLNGGGDTIFFNTSTATATIPAAGIYATTTASAANMFVDSSNNLARSTSSLKYKTNVVDATHGLAEVMQLRPVTYKGKNDGNKVFGGLIAEEVDAVGLTEFVQYAEDGSPDALAYGNMVSLLVKAIQELKAELDALKGTK